MRLDEDVGKVAQVTPFLIAKALEIFLSGLVESTLVETKSKGAKKLTSTHLSCMLIQEEGYNGR
jgi:hypothetical protein